MNKKGTTLIETIISIFLISTVVVTFLEALSIGINGTLELNRKTSALNLAKSQVDYTKSQDYLQEAGNLSLIYGSIIDEGNISDTVNYVLSGVVENASDTQPLQRITVNVSYFRGKEVQLITYKTHNGSLAVPEPQGLVVTDVIDNMPTMPQGYGGVCLGSFRGYYHVFTTGTEGPAAAHWKFDWNKVDEGAIDIGCPIIAIYEGVPPWVKTNADGSTKKDGLIVRDQNSLGGLAGWISSFFGIDDPVGIGDLPGLGGGQTMCAPCDAEHSFDGEQNPIYYMPHHHAGSWLSWERIGCCYAGGYCADNSYPCCGYSEDGGEIFWSYDNSGDSGTAEDTLVTGDLEPGTYTVLFFNSENMKNLDTTSASITFYY